MRQVRTLFTSICAIAVFASATHASGMRVLKDSPLGTVLEFSFDGWAVQPIDSLGTIAAPRGVSFDLRSGGPAVPYTHRLIGLPGPTKPRVIVESVEWAGRFPGTAIRANVPAIDPTLPHLSKVQLVTLSEPSVWRGRWVSGLYVVPQQSEGNGIRAVKRIRIRIEYGRTSAAAAPRRDAFAESALANPGAAARWGAAPSIRPSVRAARTIASDANLWATGTMIRIEIETEGIYQITSSDFERLGIDLTGVDPRQIRLFGNGGQVLPENFIASRDTTLRENAIYVSGEQDGSFDEGDRILFYGRSVNTWLPSSVSGEYSHTNNPFTRRNVYWLYIPDAGGEQGLRMDSLGTGEAPTSATTTARSRLFVDNDAIIYSGGNDEVSGKIWYAARLDAGGRYTATVQVPHPLATLPARLVVQSRTVTSSIYSIEVNGVPIDTLRTTQATITVPAGLLRNGSNTVSFHQFGGSLYVDWLELDFERDLTAVDGILTFDRLPEDGIVQVDVSGLDQPWVFDIQQFDRVRVGFGTRFVVQSQTNSPHRYVALSEDRFLTPVSMTVSGFGKPEYAQGLRSQGNGADYLIITHRDFYDACAPLEAFIEQRDTIEVTRVETDDIFKEFSGGLYDPTAIRDFLAWAVNQWQTPPSTVLFAGDGDYDYRNIVSNADKNWVPPYENGSECTDTWYSRFGSSYPQLVSGRLPVESAGQVGEYLDKLIAYESNPDYGPWRARMVLVADDEYEDTGVVSWNTVHMTEAEAFSREEAPSYMDIRKIYIGTYPTTYDPTTGARRKPGATTDLITAINEGVLAVSFIGHGNAHVWTHESIFVDNRDDKLIDTGDRPPIFVAATCNWGYWDRPENLSFPEILIFREGGAIGIVSSTRKTYVNSNDQFSTTFFAKFFDRTHSYRLGESVLLAQIQTTNSTTLSYHCLGDPRLRPALPIMNVEATALTPDSLTAFAPEHIGGQIEDAGGAPDPSWQGEVLLDVIGGTDTLIYTFHNIYNGDGTPKTLAWVKPKGHLFRGLVSAEAGVFNTNFIVPRDITLGSAGAQVKMYANNEDVDGAGAKLQIPISTQVEELNDVTPPQITVWFDQPGWASGGMTTSSPTLHIDLFDTSGINLTGDIGHDIVAILDGEDEIRLTDDFIYSRDSYSRGKVERRLYNLESGRHTLELWAWDIANNYARKEITFQVLAASGQVVLNNVLNWPNPFAKNTNFTFELSEPAEVTIKIFTASGRQVKEIGPVQANAGFNYPGGTSRELRWNGWDRYGDPVANGVYLYKIVAVGDNGAHDEKIGKLLRIR